MTNTIKHIGLGVGITLVAGLMAAGAYAAGQDTSGGQPPFAGRGPGGRGPGGLGPGGPGRGGRFGGPFGPMGPGGPAGMPLERLGLSDAQKDQAKTIMQSHQDEMKALAEREGPARTALGDAMSADVMDEATIRARSYDVAAVEADMAVAHARIRSEIFQILTADQQAQLKQMQSRLKQREEEMRQRRGQAPPRQ